MLRGCRKLCVTVEAEDDVRAGWMRGVHDEELVFHVGKSLVVHDFVEEALLSLRGQTMNGGCPSEERLCVECIREEMVCCHAVGQPAKARMAPLGMRHSPFRKASVNLFEKSYIRSC